jgi:hypothetical protein
MDFAHELATPFYHKISKTVEMKDFSQSMEILLIKVKSKPEFHPEIRVIFGNTSLQVKVNGL